jgi:hypothetical protein
LASIDQAIHSGALSKLSSNAPSTFAFTERRQPILYTVILIMVNPWPLEI